MTIILPTNWKGAQLENCVELVRSPHTHPDVLWEILHYAAHYRLSESDMRALASNPALPYKGLKTMLAEYPGEVLRNPAFRLALATDMGLLRDFGPSVRAIIAGCPHTEPGLIRLLGAKRTRPIEERIAAAGNPASPEDMLFRFLQHAWRVRESLARNSALPETLILVLSGDENHEVRATLAARRGLSERMIHRIARDRDWHVRMALARNPELPLSLQIHLSHDAYYRVRANLATHPDLSPSLLAKMAEREQGPTVLCAVMENPRTPEAALIRIAQGPIERYAVHARQCLEAR